MNMEAHVSVVEADGGGGMGSAILQEMSDSLGSGWL